MNYKMMFSKVLDYVTKRKEWLENVDMTRFEGDPHGIEIRIGEIEGIIEILELLEQNISQ